MTDSSIPPDEEFLSPPDGEWCPVHYQYNCTELSHGVSEPDTSLFLGSVDDFTVADFSAPEELKDLPPENIPVEDVQVGDGSCVVCGAPTFRPPGLTKAGHKKRTPKYCDLHNPKLRLSQERSFTSGVENLATLQRMQGELSDDLKLLGVLAGPLLPVTGMYVWTNADSFTAALLKLCQNNQRALRILHRAASVAPVYEVARDVAGVVYSVQVDGGKLQPHTTVSRRLGVDIAYDTVYPESTPGNETNVGTNGHRGPPRYASVQ